MFYRFEQYKKQRNLTECVVSEPKLYQATKGDKVLWVLGTHHHVPLSCYPSHYQEIFKNAECLFSEYFGFYQDVTTTQLEQVKAFDHGLPLKAALDEQDALKPFANQIIKDYQSIFSTNIPVERLNFSVTWDLTWQFKNIGIDRELYQWYKARHKPTYTLNNLESTLCHLQYRANEAIQLQNKHGPIHASRLQTQCTLLNTCYAGQYADDANQSYQDFDEYFGRTNETNSISMQHQSMLHTKNTEWLSLLLVKEKMHRNCLFACGDKHLQSFDNSPGLLKMLESLEYSITPIKP